MYVCMYVCMYVGMYVCRYVCVYVHTYVRTYVCTCTNTHIITNWTYIIMCDEGQPNECMVKAWLYIYTVHTCTYVHFLLIDMYLYCSCHNYLLFINHDVLLYQHVTYSIAFFRRHI